MGCITFFFSAIAIISVIIALITSGFQSGSFDFTSSSFLINIIVFIIFLRVIFKIVRKVAENKIDSQPYNKQRIINSLLNKKMVNTPPPLQNEKEEHYVDVSNIEEEKYISKKCPRCGEEIKFSSKKCSSCNYKLD